MKKKLTKKQYEKVQMRGEIFQEAAVIKVAGKQPLRKELLARKKGKKK